MGERTSCETGHRGAFCKFRRMIRLPIARRHAHNGETMLGHRRSRACANGRYSNPQNAGSSSGTRMNAHTGRLLRSPQNAAAPLRIANTCVTRGIPETRRPTPRRLFRRLTNAAPQLTITTTRDGVSNAAAIRLPRQVLNGSCHRETTRFVHSWSSELLRAADAVERFTNLLQDPDDLRKLEF